MSKKITVSELVFGIKRLLIGKFQQLEVLGEVSNFSQSSSGHVYFMLKDQRAAISCVIFKSNLYRIKVADIQDGMNISVSGQCSVFDSRGSLQIIVSGLAILDREGLFRKKFEQNKKHFQNKGYFDLSHKKKIPDLPKRIGIITSPTGAALLDFLKIFRRRSFYQNILVVPATMQGNEGANSVCQAIDKITKNKLTDFIIITRGGGSIEDLWCFNEPALIEKVFRCPIPVASAIGHERDFTLLDYVADVRYETPSAAAEQTTEFQQKILKNLDMTHKSLVHAVHQKLYSLNKKLETLKPHRSLVKLGHKYSGYRKSLEDSKIDAHSFYTLKLAPLKLDLDDFQRKSVNTMQSKMNHYGLRLERSRIKIFNSDPKAILKKGYAMAMDKDHRIIRNRKEMLKAKKPLSLEFHDGRINFTIEGSK